MARVCGDSCAVVVQSYHTPANSIGWAPGSYTGNSIYVLDLAASDAELVVGEWISAVALSDGLVAGGTVEGNVDLWDRADGAPLQRFGGHSGGVTALAFHDGCLLSGSVDRTVRIWNLSTFAEVGTIGHGGGVRALSAHGDVLLTASDDHTLRLFAWKSGRELARFTDDASLDACALAPDLRAVVAGGLSGQLHVLRPNHALAERLTGG
jgi:WD40 repeat protein